jgi:hypothetical protein
MRIEQWMPTSMTNYSQWYVNCAHVNIIGPGGGTPTGFARFPGTYVDNGPGKQALIHCSLSTDRRESHSALSLIRPFSFLSLAIRPLYSQEPGSQRRICAGG